MAGNTGGATIETLLAAVNTSAAEWGLDRIQAVLSEDLANHNGMLAVMLGDLVEITPDRQRKTGATNTGRMSKVDEFGRAPTQRPAFPGQVAFPLDKYQYALGWSDDWLKLHTPNDMAILVQAAQKAHVLRIKSAIAQAIFGATNITRLDYMTDNISFIIRRLTNADGQPIPDGPTGASFTASTHTHYTATAALTDAGLLALETNVLEHGISGSLKVCINIANQAAVMALASSVKYQDPRLQLGTGIVPTQRLNIQQADNRAVGLHGVAEVWVKPWVPANYAFCYAADAPNKPLAMRVRPGSAGPNLRIAAQIPDYPLYAEWMEDYFGFGAYARSAAAAYYFAAGAWADPTIAD